MNYELNVDVELVHQMRELESLQFQYKLQQLIFLAIELIRVKPLPSQYSDIDKERIEEIIHFCCLKNVFKSNNKMSEVFGILEPKILTYMEKKFLKENLIIQMTKLLQPSIEFKKRISNKSLKYTVFNIEDLHNDIIVAAKKRTELQEQLLRLKERKLNLLKNCAMQKFNSHQENGAQLMHITSQTNDLKAMIFKGMVLQEIFYRTDFTTKAIREIKTYLDNELSNQN